MKDPSFLKRMEIAQAITRRGCEVVGRCSDCPISLINWKVNKKACSIYIDYYKDKGCSEKAKEYVKFYSLTLMFTTLLKESK